MNRTLDGLTAFQRTRWFDRNHWMATLSSNWTYKRQRYFRVRGIWLFPASRRTRGVRMSVPLVGKLKPRNPYTR